MRDIVDDGKKLRKHTVFDSFGRITDEDYFDSSGAAISESHAEAVDQLFGYTGRLWDEATGLQNNLNRWYDADTGRWMSQDPIGFEAGDANLYRYVGNQATTSVDPDGLKELLPNSDEEIDELEELFPRHPNERLDDYLAGYGFKRDTSGDFTTVEGVFTTTYHINDSYFRDS